MRSLTPASGDCSTRQLRLRGVPLPLSSIGLVSSSGDGAVIMVA
jgi:hypothetical protein